MKRSLGRVLAGAFALAALTSAPRGASAEERRISLADAAGMARARGYDVAVAAAQVRGAQADVRTASQLPNPVVSAELGRTLSCGGTCNSGSPWGWGAGLSDQGLIEGAITRKRALRADVAERGVDAAKLGKVDAERLVVAQTKIQYVATAAAAAKLDFTKDVAASLAKSVEVNRVRYPRVIDEGQLARVEQEGLKAEQEVDRAFRDLRQQTVALAFLVGTPEAAADLTVDREVLKFRVPDALAQASPESLYRLALDNRPDRRQANAKEQQADAQIAFSQRQRFPDIALQVNYQQQGTGDYTSQFPTLTLGVGLPLPLFYRQQGEILRAEADKESAQVALRRIDGSLRADIDGAYSAWLSSRALLQRYETALLDRAKVALDRTNDRYTAGKDTLTDLLDAQRSYVAVNSDYYAELLNYWTAVFQLEQAVGKELVP